MDSEGKQYTVLQNVVFCDQETASSSNFNYPPLSPYNGDVANLPSTSGTGGYYECTSVQNWTDPIYPVVYEAGNNKTVENEQKTVEPVKEVMVKPDTPLKVLINSTNIINKPKLNTDNETVVAKPNLSFICLIGLAFRNGRDKCLAVKEIYDFIEAIFPFYNNTSAGWRSSIRHNLSFSNYFLKMATEKAAGKTRGYIWRVNPSKELELNRLVDCALEREKENTIKALVKPDYYSSLKLGELRLNVVQSSTLNEMDSNQIAMNYTPGTQQINSQYVAMNWSPVTIVQSTTTPLRNNPVRDNVPRESTGGSSILSALLGISEPRVQ